MATTLIPRYERLEHILNGLTSGTLEFPLNNDNYISMIKTDLEALGYNITYECSDRERHMYHLHIKKRRI